MRTVADLIKRVGSNKRLAQVTGVRACTVAGWKAENHLPGRHLPKLCSELEIPPDELLPLVRPWERKAA